MEKKIIGSWGEGIAKKYLEDKGYTILETNWRHHHKELDIIVYKNGLVGVEVKTRRSNTDLAFTILKAEQVGRLRLALKAYCFLHALNYSKSQLDLIIIKIKNPTTISLKHYRNL